MFYSNLLATIGLFTAQPALACVRDDASFHVPILGFVLMASTVWAAAFVFFVRNIRFSIILATTVLFSILLGAVGIFVVPAFAKIFASFDGELPWQTTVVVSAQYALWLPALFVLVLWRVSQNNPRQQRYFVIALFVEIALFMGVIEAIYSPIFALGCVV